MWMPFFLSHLARAYAELGKFEDAWCSADEAMTAIEATNERWCEAEVHRTAGEIMLLATKPEFLSGIVQVVASLRKDGYRYGEG